MKKSTKKLSNFLKSRAFVSILSSLLFIATTFLLILVAKGYNFDLENKTLEETGILVISSEPKGAIIYIDDKIKDVTNTNFTNLAPQEYEIRLEKEGYTSWEKKLRIEKGIVIEIEARLFPYNPSLSPITIYGVTNPKINSNQDKIIFQVKDSNEKNGLWLLSFNDNFLGKGYDLKQMLKDSEGIKFSELDFYWSPDGNELFILNSSVESKNYIVPISNTTTINDLIETVKNKDQTLEDWKIEEERLYTETLSIIDDEVKNELLEIKNPIWSNKKDKFWFNQNAKVKIFDMEKGEIYDTGISENQYSNLVWYPDGERLIVLEKTEENVGKLSILETDNTNKMSIYEGTLYSNNVFVSLDGSKVFFLTNFNPNGSELYNLYAVNLD